MDTIPDFYVMANPWASTAFGGSAPTWQIPVFLSIKEGFAWSETFLWIRITCLFGWKPELNLPTPSAQFRSNQLLPSNFLRQPSSSVPQATDGKAVCFIKSRPNWNTIVKHQVAIPNVWWNVLRWGPKTTKTTNHIKRSTIVPKAAWVSREPTGICSSDVRSIP